MIQSGVIGLDDQASVPEDLYLCSVLTVQMIGVAASSYILKLSQDSVFCL